MKKSLVLAMAMALGVTASAYAANPFSDVPAGHWAYDSINKLAAAGVIEGYGDSTFGGDKLMTRYEMAQIVAKAMAKGANVDKLAAEFADELDNLGVRVANLEKKADNVKIAGTIKAMSYSYTGDQKKKGDNYFARLRTDLTVRGQINDDWSYTGLIRNEQILTDNVGNENDVRFQRAYLDGKLGGAKVRAGRYSFCDFAGGNIHDTRMDGGQLSYGKEVQLTVGAGKATDANAVDDNNMVYANLGAKLGVVDANVGYYKFDNLKKVNDSDNDDAVWAVGVAFPVVKDLKLGLQYLKSDVDSVKSENGTFKDVDDDGYVISLDYKGAKGSKPGSWGIYGKYYNQGAGTYVAHTMDGLYPEEGFKGYKVGVNYALAKNIVANVDYYDLESKEKNISKDYKTIFSTLVFNF